MEMHEVSTQVRLSSALPKNESCCHRVGCFLPQVLMLRSRPGCFSYARVALFHPSLDILNNLQLQLAILSTSRWVLVQALIQACACSGPSHRIQRKTSTLAKMKARGQNKTSCIAPRQTAGEKWELCLKLKILPSPVDEMLSMWWGPILICRTIPAPFLLAVVWTWIGG
jgi:hypothetical protein